MLDSNDLFSQIGFVVDYQQPHSQQKYIKSGYNSKNTNFENFVKKKQFQGLIEQQFEQPLYITFLEIQLSQNDNHILQIKSFDDPHQLAEAFCLKHNLNKLAIEIVEKKIIEAKQNQESKILENNDKKTQRKLSSQNKIISANQKVFSNNCNQQFLINAVYKDKTPQTKSQKGKESFHQSCKTPKNFDNSSKFSRIQIKQIQNSVQPDRPNHKRTKSQINEACQNLYFRGMLQAKAQEQKRKRYQQQKQKQQEQQLTFKPKINIVSEKIIEFRRQTGTVKPKNPNKVKKEISQKFYNELKQCTFTPQINKISKIIINNRQAYRTQNEHFNQVFHEQNSYEKDKNLNQQNIQINRLSLTHNRKSKKILQTQKQLEEQKLFKPKLNPKSIDRIKQPFFVRLQKAIESKQRIKQGQLSKSQYSFQPKVGRAPYYQTARSIHSQKNKENVPIWQQLYQQSKKRASRLQQQKQRNLKPSPSQSTHPQTCQSFSNTISSKISTFKQDAKGSTNLYYENLIQKRISQVFQLLDSDGDGLITPDTIEVQNLNKNMLIFLKPIFQEMDELDAELNFNEFTKAVINLLNDSDPYKKGLFLSDGHKVQDNQCTFQPQINGKSKQLTEYRGQNVHLELYEQGIKNLHKKQFLLEKQRAKKQEQQLSECSFKPCLKLGEKSYKPYIFNQKLSEIQYQISNSNENPTFNEYSYQESHYEQNSYYN